MSVVVVVGGCIVDLMSYIERFPRPGETMVGKEFYKGFGGKGANQCVMAKKLGASTALIAKLGEDTFGQEYMLNLKDLGINHDFVTMTKTSHTSTAAISVTEDGQNSIIYVPGAIDHLLPGDIIAAEGMIQKSRVLLCTFECPLDALSSVLAIAKKHNVKTVVNAAPSMSSSYEAIYHLVDIICLNEVEAEDATKLPVKTLEDAGKAVNFLLRKGCSLVILTLGSKGAIFQAQTEESFTHVSAKSVSAVDSTGAGDAFMGSLVYYLAYHPHVDLKSAIKRSCDIATLSVLKKGTQSSFPQKEELSEEFFS